MHAEHRSSIAILALLLLLVAACGGSAATTTSAPPTTIPPATTTTVAPQESGDVLEVAAAQGDLNTFLSALEAAGIMEDFHGEGPFTLFVPTDAAFTAYLDDAGMTQAEVFAGKEMLQAILNYHIVNMAEDAAKVMGMNGQAFTTANGQPLEVTVDGDTVKVGGATIKRYDIQASNGVIHVIDKVLTPSEG